MRFFVYNQLLIYAEDPNELFDFYHPGSIQMQSPL